MKVHNYITFTNIKTIINTKVFRNFVILSSISLLQMISNIILGRMLSKSDYGIFSFVFMNLVNFLSVFFSFGQGGAILRFFSSRNLEEYQWKQYIIKILFIAIIPILLVSLFIIRYYKLDNYWYFIIVVSLIFTVCTTFISNILNSTGNVNTATFIERTHSILFFVGVSLCYFLSVKFNLFTIALVKLSTLFIIIPIFTYIFIIWKSGNTKIEKNVIKDGLSLWEIYITVLVLQSLDAFFIVKILDFKELALFNIMSMLMQIYELSRISIFKVYSQKFSKTRDINIRQLFLIILVLIVLISIFYLVSTNFILDIMFKGKYQAPISLLLLFCLASSVNMLYIIPSCYLVGHSTRKEMQFMSVINLSSLGIKIILILLLSGLNLNGFLLAAIISQMIRVFSAYYLMIRGEKKAKLSI